MGGWAQKMTSFEDVQFVDIVGGSEEVQKSANII